MLSDLHLRSFRCFEALRVSLDPGFNFFLGSNGQGKTTILEAACVLLRLQSQRSASLAPVVRRGHSSFAVSGLYDEHGLEFRYSALRRKLTFDKLEQRSAAEYLRLARVVSFANTDIELVRGTGEARRRYLDFLGAQITPLYRPALRSYERVLRSRNALLKSAHPGISALAAYDPLLLEHGTRLTSLRRELVGRIIPLASAAHRAISGISEKLGLRYLAGTGDDFATSLAKSRWEELRLRQTVVGPHRDDLILFVDGMAANQFASEGQHRTIALALKVAQAQIFSSEGGPAPLLLLDDIFGELDPTRRNHLLAHLPAEAQKLVTATSMQWLEQAPAGPTLRLEEGQLRRV
ncbi:MAG: DNA replication/repair protein RecF [Chthoniobacterales bacterium]|nr:DNA replication/repair protein RecF [Chthoniobacterales bacterium]